MNRQIAQVVNGNLNHPKITQALQEYINFRIEALRNLLETCKNQNHILEYQGAIEELRKFHKIRETALAVLESERSGNG